MSTSPSRGQREPFPCPYCSLTIRCDAPHTCHGSRHWLAAPAPLPPPEPDTQEVVNQACRVMARWIDTLVYPIIEEHWADPDERWRQLRLALRRYVARVDGMPSNSTTGSQSEPPLPPT